MTNLRRRGESTSLEAWCRAELTREHSAGPLRRVLLRHASPDNRENARAEIVAEVHVDGANDTAEGLAARLRRAAEEDAAFLPGARHVYFARARFGESEAAEEQGDGRCVVAVLRDDADDDELPAGGYAETPDARGLVAASMRHTEAAMRLAMGGSEAALRHLMTAFDSVSKRNAELEAQLAAQRKTFERASDREHERERERREEERKERDRAMWRDKLDMLLPVLVSKLGGASEGGALKALAAASGHVSRGEALTRKLLESVEPGQLEQLQRVLTLEQQIALEEMFRVFVFGEKGEDAQATEGKANGHGVH